MYLSNLRLIGFKSFSQKTSIDFSDGIVAVIGPNGCGKSNIIDAIRWVLGEQRYTALRSSKMEDVIFNGSARFSAQNIAEVTLTIENNKGILPLIYKQVAITRRLFRSGESEYYINGNRCRLRDINDLFMDTGMGNHSYSIIEQQMVSAVLSDKKDERKNIFDEAAGIMKYKERKKEALNKLNANENDLLRVADIIMEIEKNVATLKRQAQKANRFNLLKEQLKELEFIYFRHRLTEIDGEWQPLNGQLSALRLEKDEIHTRFRSLEAESETVSHTLLNLNQTLQQLQKDYNTQTENHHQGTQSMKVLQERLLFLQKENEGFEREVATNRIQQGVVSQMVGEKVEEEVAHQTNYAELGEQLKNMRDSMLEDELFGKSVLQKREEMQRKVDRLRQQKVKCEQERALLNQRIQLLESDQQNFSRQVAEFEQLQSVKNEDLITLQGQRNQNMERVEELEEEGYRYEYQLQAILDEKADIMQKWQEKERQLLQNKDKLTLLKSKELQDELLQGDEKKIAEWFSQHGIGYSMIMDHINPDNGYEHSIQKLLWYLRAIFLLQRQQANDLKATDFSSAGVELLMALDDDSQLPVVPEGYKLLSQVVTLDPELGKPLLRVLDRALFCESLFVVWDELERLAPWIVVDRGGNLWDGRSGYIHFTNIKEKRIELSHLFGRKMKIVQMEEVGETLIKELQYIDTEKQRVESRFNSIKSQSDQLLKEKQQVSEELQRIGTRLQLIEHEITQLKKRLDDTNQNNSRQTLAIDEFRQKIDELTRAENGIETELVAMIEQLRGIDETYQSFEMNLAQKKEALNQQHIEAVRAEEHYKRIVQEKKQFERQLEQYLQREKEIVDGLTRNQEQDNEIRIKIDGFEQSIHKLAQQIEQINREMEELQLKNDRLQKEQRMCREKEEKVQQLIDQSKDALFHLEKEKEVMVEQLRGKYQIELEQLNELEIQPGKSLPDESYPEMIHELEQKLVALGNVNFEAIEEYEIQRQRHEFYITQREDLEKAKMSLLESIQKLNKTAEEMYLTTFASIKENFYKIFTTLFNGGECDLLLEQNPDDSLDMDITVMARPKGKKIQHISLLSGGEKTLTSIALLFAIYLVKPSPYCILDEVDAPLDDANIVRFLNLLREFSQNTQFILITHNKRTMEAADVLYGVTMEEPGVSKIVSVNIKQERLQAV